MTVGDLVAPLVVVALLYVGFFKGSPSLEWVPVDLTLVCLIAVVLAVTANLLSRREPVTLPALWIVFIPLLVPASLYTVTNPAAVATRLKLVIPLLAVIGVMTLVKSERRRCVWVWLHVLVGVALIAFSSVGADDATERLTGAGSNTIAAGRASGVAIVVLIILLLSPGGLPRAWMKVTAAATLVWLVDALISTGSRGPVLACAAAVLVVTAAAPGRGRLLRIAGGLAAVGIGWLLLADATGLGATRITRSLQGRDSLTGSRQGLWDVAFDVIPQHPLGIGWGNFWAVLPPSARLDSGYVQYPHNVLLEILLEAGWLAGACALLLLLASLARLRRAAVSPHAAALFGIAVFFILNAMVSGNLNDNRMMWAAVAIAWVDTGWTTGRDRPRPAAGPADLRGSGRSPRGREPQPVAVTELSRQSSARTAVT